MPEDIGLLWGDDGNVLKLTVLMVVPIREYTKHHSTVQFKWVNFMLHKVYLNKAVLKKLMEADV